MILAMPALTIDHHHNHHHQNKIGKNENTSTFILQRKSSRRLSSTRGFNTSLSLAPNKKLTPEQTVENDVEFENEVDLVEDTNIDHFLPKPISVTSTAEKSLGATAGWIRVYEGLNPDSNESRVVYLTHCTTTRDVCRDMLLSPDLTLWLTYGGSTAAQRRLGLRERPLLLQDAFLLRLGYSEASRRARLGVDTQLRHLLRLSTGPAASSPCAGSKSGHLQVLKGHVFPQWKRRPVALYAGKLLIYPGCDDGQPDVLNLSGGSVEARTPRCGRLLLRVAPLQQPQQEQPVKHVFFGFTRAWERDLWLEWLQKATTLECDPERVDLSRSGLRGLSEHALGGGGGVGGGGGWSAHRIEELDLGHNELQGAGLEMLYRLSRLRVLLLPGNNLEQFPRALLQLSTVRCLDLSDNKLQALPPEICLMTSLEEIRVERNALRELPDSLCSLTSLNTLLAAENQVKFFPVFLIRMRALGFMDFQTTANNLNIKDHLEDNDKNDLNQPLSKVSLRANQLKGNIILGNYGNLAQLDLSENSIECLDLSALDNLKVLQCSRNKLTELTLNGRSLTSLIAGNNELQKLIVSPPPSNLQHFDISYNSLEELPTWVCGCHDLQVLFASHNKLKSLPEHLFCSELSSLHTLQLGYNELEKLPTLPRRRLALQEIFLQCNRIAALPENFFSSCTQLRVLNLSNNRLTHLPVAVTGEEDVTYILERLYLTANCLTESITDTIASFSGLKIWHAAYNSLATLPESCVAALPDLEELVLSGNRLQHLPDSLARLEHLSVLRVHSNRLQSAPGFSESKCLRVLDLAHNQLDRINLESLVPPQLQFLDLSCNSQLHVDPRQFQACRSQRPMSLVDVSGRNRAALPSTPWPYREGGDGHLEPPWRVGFSETAGDRNKLFISQLRLPAFCNTEGLFGIFDGESGGEIPDLLIKTIPRLLLEELTVKETATDYMKYTLLSAHRELKQRGQRSGVDATLCHISRTKRPDNEFLPTARRYVLRLASVGEAMAVVGRPSGVLRLTPPTPSRRIGNSAAFPLVVPDPEVAELTLTEQDEFVIIANKRLWEVLSPESAVEEVRAQENVILAAKRLQDMAQSYGAESNISVLVVKFNDRPSDVEQLMRELRSTIRSKTVNPAAPSEVCGFGCCCELQNNCCHSVNTRLSPRTSDRSSPSGQSDQAGVVENPPMRNNITGGLKVARAVRAKIEEEREETDSGLSEEQFKCWEYMLEQNTQLLFDKELNTLTRGVPRRIPTSANVAAPTGVSTLRSQKSLSSSSPHLAGVPPTQVSATFLSRHFGSARNFCAAASLKPAVRFGSGRSGLSGGPNAAYFGSLQRLMPYNLEYDFNVTRERSGPQWDPETDSRMQQYWGVATTEL